MPLCFLVLTFDEELDLRSPNPDYVFDRSRHVDGFQEPPAFGLHEVAA